MSHDSGKRTDPQATTVSPTESELPIEGPGSMIGRYKLLQVITRFEAPAREAAA